MYPITFRKGRAAYFLDRLLKGQSILHDPGQSGWTLDEMLQLAGACFFAAAAQGPRRTAPDLRGGEPTHPEHPEAEFETVMNDLHAALEFIAQWTQMVYDADYDEGHESIVRCGIQAVDTGVQTSVVPVEGFKSP